VSEQLVAIDAGECPGAPAQCGAYLSRVVASPDVLVFAGRLRLEAIEPALVLHEHGPPMPGEAVEDAAQMQGQFLELDAPGLQRHRLSPIVSLYHRFECAQAGHDRPEPR